MKGRAAFILAVVVAAVAVQLVLRGDPTLKLRVAVALLGWDGLINVIQDSFAERLLGKKETKSRHAWQEFASNLSQIELEYLSPARGITSKEDIAEGHRYLSHVVKLGLDLYVENDIHRPHFVKMVSPMQKVLGDNPDAIYYAVNIDPNRTYKCTGKLTGEVYLSFTLAEAPCYGCYTNAVVGDVNHRQLKFKEDGKSYELYISRDRPEGADNWLKIEIGPAGVQLQVITRHYFEGDIEAQVDPSVNVQVRIEIVGEIEGTNEYPRFRDDDIMAESLSRVTTFLREHTLGVNNDPATAPSWFSFTPNVLGHPSSFRDDSRSKSTGGGFGAVDISYSGGLFRLENGEALIVKAHIPSSCLFANIMLWNRYLQTLDYLNGRISLNRKQMHMDKDNNVTIVVSPAPRPVTAINWINSEGRKSGYIFWRFILCEEKLNAISVEVVQHSNL